MAEPKAAAFVDTSVIVRYLTNDPPPLAERAASLLEGEEQLTLSEVVLVEAAYVLTKVYEVPREATVDALIDSCNGAISPCSMSTSRSRSKRCASAVPPAASPSSTLSCGHKRATPAPIPSTPSTRDFRRGARKAFMP